MNTRLANLQQAADDVGVIAETAKALSQLMDRFFENYQEDLRSQLASAFPTHTEINPNVVKALGALESKWTPTSD